MKNENYVKPKVLIADDEESYRTCMTILPTTSEGKAKVQAGRGVKINYIYYWSKSVFEKRFAVILITFLPPLVSPCKGGKQEESGSLTFIRGGLGRGKKYLIHQSRLFKHPLIVSATRKFKIPLSQSDMTRLILGSLTAL